jgi:hypothetical protein
MHSPLPTYFMKTGKVWEAVGMNVTDETNNRLGFARYAYGDSYTRTVQLRDRAREKEANGEEQREEPQHEAEESAGGGWSGAVRTSAWWFGPTAQGSG